jgi:hypothetical protein
MNRTLVVAVASLGLFGWALAPRACAQGGNYVRPGYGSSPAPVSPWLNLNRAGTPPANNLYNLVRPQFDTSASLQQIQQQVLTNQLSVGGLESTVNAPTTGHPFGFQTHLRYFQTLRRQNLASSPTATAGFIRPQAQQAPQMPAR